MKKLLFALASLAFALPAWSDPPGHRKIPEHERVWVEAQVASHEIAKDPKKWENKPVNVAGPTASLGTAKEKLTAAGDGRYILTTGKPPNELTVVYTETARTYYHWAAVERVRAVYRGEVRLDPAAGVLRLYLSHGLNTARHKPVPKSK